MVSIPFNGPVGVVGARGFVGSQVVQLLRNQGCTVYAFSRNPEAQTAPGVQWLPHPQVHVGCTAAQLRDLYPHPIKQWVLTGPIWALHEFFELFEAVGATKLLALSSTSRHSKVDSADPQEQALAQQLAHGESALQAWAESHQVDWVVLRPTLIYGLTRDRNVTDIARWVKRLGVFPLLGAAKGLRQPVRVEDVARACLQALASPAARNHAYDISGGETLSYRQLVKRVFRAFGKPALVLPVPLWVFRLAVAMLRKHPRYPHVSASMAQRMNKNLVFDHSDATRDFAYQPAKFYLGPQDLP